MQRSIITATRKTMGLGILLLVGTTISGCTHWGGSHGGHPYSWGGGYGGCQLDFSKGIDDPANENPGHELISNNHTEVSNESTRGDARVDSAGIDWVVIGSGSTDVSTTAGDAEHAG